MIADRETAIIGATSALQCLDRRLAALLAYSSDIITVLDASGKIRYGSPVTTRILGNEPGANLGHMLSILHPEDQDAAVEALIANVEAGDGDGDDNRGASRPS